MSLKVSIELKESTVQFAWHYLGHCDFRCGQAAELEFQYLFSSDGLHRKRYTDRNKSENCGYEFHGTICDHLHNFSLDDDNRGIANPIIFPSTSSYQEGNKGTSLLCLLSKLFEFIHRQVIADISMYHPLLVLELLHLQETNVISIPADFSVAAQTLIREAATCTGINENNIVMVVSSYAALRLCSTLYPSIFSGPSESATAQLDQIPPRSKDLVLTVDIGLKLLELVLYEPVSASKSSSNHLSSQKEQLHWHALNHTDSSTSLCTVAQALLSWLYDVYHSFYELNHYQYPVMSFAWQHIHNVLLLQSITNELQTLFMNYDHSSKMENKYLLIPLVTLLPNLQDRNMFASFIRQNYAKHPLLSKQDANLSSSPSATIRFVSTTGLLYLSFADFLLPKILEPLLTRAIHTEIEAFLSTYTRRPISVNHCEGSISSFPEVLCIGIGALAKYKIIQESLLYHSSTNDTTMQWVFPGSSFSVDHNQVSEGIMYSENNNCSVSDGTTISTEILEPAPAAHRTASLLDPSTATSISSNTAAAHAVHPPTHSVSEEQNHQRSFLRNVQRLQSQGWITPETVAVLGGFLLPSITTSSTTCNFSTTASPTIPSSLATKPSAATTDTNASTIDATTVKHRSSNVFQSEQQFASKMSSSHMEREKQRALGVRKTSFLAPSSHSHNDESTAVHNDTNDDSRSNNSSHDDIEYFSSSDDHSSTGDILEERFVNLPAAKSDDSTPITRSIDGWHVEHPPLCSCSHSLASSASSGAPNRSRSFSFDIVDHTANNDTTTTDNGAQYDFWDYNGDEQQSKINGAQSAVSDNKDNSMNQDVDTSHLQKNHHLHINCDLVGGDSPSPYPQSPPEPVVSQHHHDTRPPAVYLRPSFFLHPPADDTNNDTSNNTNNNTQNDANTSNTLTVDTANNTIINTMKHPFFVPKKSLPTLKISKEQYHHTNDNHSFSRHSSGQSSSRSSRSSDSNYWDFQEQDDSVHHYDNHQHHQRHYGHPHKNVSFYSPSSNNTCYDIKELAADEEEEEEDEEEEVRTFDHEQDLVFATHRHHHRPSNVNINSSNNCNDNNESSYNNNNDNDNNIFNAINEEEEVAIDDLSQHHQNPSLVLIPLHHSSAHYNLDVHNNAHKGTNTTTNTTNNTTDNTNHENLQSNHSEYGVLVQRVQDFAAQLEHSDVLAQTSALYHHYHTDNNSNNSSYQRHTSDNDNFGNDPLSPN